MRSTGSGDCAIAFAATIELLARTQSAVFARRNHEARSRAALPAVGGALLWLAPAASLDSFELVSVEASREGSAYLLRIEATFDASAERLLPVLTDYERIHELHPRMVESRSLGTVGPATEETYIRFEGCVLFFCRTLHRVERIRIQGESLLAEDVPGRGSFREGRTKWRFSPEGTGTRLRYETRFVPAFHVPPLVGPAVLARSVERMTLETMAEADRRAGLPHD